MTGKRVFSYLVISVVAASVLPLCDAAAQSSYLRKGDKIFMYGDSVGSQDGHQDHMQWVLDTLYPDAGIKIVNRGSGGKSSGSAVTGMQMVPREGAKNRPTIVTIMYGVNDLRWNWSNMPPKIASFTGYITKAIEIGRKKKLDIILLRETHLSRGATTDGYAASLTSALQKILKAQDVLAAELNVPVIDVFGAYRKALQDSWIKDINYRFTPDMIHPTQPGHAAIATEVLRAMGVGLPLSKGKRGPLHLVPDAPVILDAVDQSTIVADDGSLEVEVLCRNMSGKPISGKVTIVASPHKQTLPAKAAAYGLALLKFKIPAAKMKGRWAIMPLYMTFKGKGMFSASHALLHYSRIAGPGKAALSEAKDFGNWECVRSKNVPPVTGIAASMNRHGLKVEFKWADPNVVPAQPGFRDKRGRVYKDPLDLNTNGAQRSDAVEFVFDLRPAGSTGRFTCALGRTPKGCVRFGIYKSKDPKTGKITPKLVLPGNVPDHKVSLTAEDNNMYVLRYASPFTAPAKKGPPANPDMVSYTMRVTDCNEYGRGTIYNLTGKKYIKTEIMSFIRISHEKSGVFFRIGY